MINDILRMVIIAQLAATVVCLSVIMVFKRSYYFADRKFINMVILGMILLCVSGAAQMIERLGSVVTWRAFILWAASLLIDAGTFFAFMKSSMWNRDHFTQ